MCVCVCLYVCVYVCACVRVCVCVRRGNGSVTVAPVGLLKPPQASGDPLPNWCVGPDRGVLKRLRTATVSYQAPGVWCAGRTDHEEDARDFFRFWRPIGGTGS